MLGWVLNLCLYYEKGFLGKSCQLFSQTRCIIDVWQGSKCITNLVKWLTLQSHNLRISSINCGQIRRKLRIWSHLLKKSLMENFIFCEVLTTINLHQWLLSILAKALINISKLKQDQTCTICHWTTWNSLQIIHKKFFIIFWTFLHFNIPWCSWTTVVCYSDACLKWLHIANIIWIVSSQPYRSSSSWKIRKFFVLLFWDKNPLRIWSSFCSVFFCVCTENRHLRKSGHNKWSLSLRIAYENVKKSARNCGYILCVKVSVLGVFLVRIFWY